MVALVSSAFAQGTREDYERAEKLRERMRNKVFKTKLEPHWFPDGEAFWYRNKLAGGKEEFVRVDCSTGKREVIADDDKLHRTSPPAKKKNRNQKPGPSRRSPDGTMEARIKEHNLFVHSRESDETFALTEDGNAEYRMTGRVFWSPDSTRLVAMSRRPEQEHKVTVVDSSPKDRVQPRLESYQYLKPGDRIAEPGLRLFDVRELREVPIDNALFKTPWDLRDVHWCSDASGFTFVYNQRGHQVLRLLFVDAKTGSVRTLIDERSDTFIDYSQKYYLHHLEDTAEVLWMSERSGWNHLYLIDVKTGKVKNPVTQGEWVVRGVVDVDDEKRQLWFKACGIRPGQDPYHVHYARVNLDGSGLTVLTEGDGTHTVQASPGRDVFVDTWSRVDQPPIHELRRSEDGSLICELERADASALFAAGWKAPVRFVAKGRDGKTDIHGILLLPTNLDPARKYPVIEQIYAGPHGQFVPKAFHAFDGAQTLAELGFIVVKIDGMGTNWRSKRFHDVCWKNLKDSGFPDRIAWMKAAAEKHPFMDLSRVGIYGGSAGGQSALAALLFHPEFYKVAAADCGCHDNRMDKIWWNEAWMGWPVGPHYAENSNVTHAHKLQGKLLLTVGELDTNVDPASTLQVVNALIKADKDFELIVFPGKGHSVGESPYGVRRRRDLFVRHLWGVEPRAER